MKIRVSEIIRQLATLKVHSKRTYPETSSIWRDIDQTVRGIQAVKGRPEAEEEIEEALDELEDSIQQLEDVFAESNDKENGARARRLVDMMFDI